MSSSFYDDKETLDAQVREDSLFASLRETLKRATSESSAWRNHLSGVNPDDVVDRSSLSRLPRLSKSELMSAQEATPPYGGFALESSESPRGFASPGPIFEPQNPGSDPWRAARALFAAGARRGDGIVNCFSYHLTPGGFIVDTAARALGAWTLPAGPSDGEAASAAISRLGPSMYCGAPDYLNILLDKASASGTDVSCVRSAGVSGAALPPSLRETLRGKGVETMQFYATAEAGLIAYETDASGDNGMVVAEDILVEIVDPDGSPVEEGDVGEVTVSVFGGSYPMIRLSTGDLSAVLPGSSPCGRTNSRLRGWLGRADQSAKVRGMFVRPEQISALSSRLGDRVSRVRLRVRRRDERDEATLLIESEASGSGAESLSEEASRAAREMLKIRVEVELVSAGSLPDDGKAIADERG